MEAFQNLTLNYFLFLKDKCLSYIFSAVSYIERAVCHLLCHLSGDQFKSKPDELILCGVVQS